jgi:hypothetical protein
MGLLTSRPLPLGAKIATSVLVLCVGVVLMMAATSTLACSCPPVEHACEAYTATPIIFTGTVVRLGARETTSNRASYSQNIQFDVNEPFKGTRTDVITITRVHVPSSCPSQRLSQSYPPERRETRGTGGLFIRPTSGNTGEGVIVGEQLRSDCGPTRPFCCPIGARRQL